METPILAVGRINLSRVMEFIHSQKAICSIVAISETVSSMELARSCVYPQVNKSRKRYTTESGRMVKKMDWENTGIPKTYFTMEIGLETSRKATEHSSLLKESTLASGKMTKKMELAFSD